ncbi:MAG: radical SAM protein [Bacillota bacterium]|nr:radical SAM protein [Bacillota bacterium]
MTGIMEREMICLAHEVRLRKEFFGGLVFNRDSGTVIDVDREAFSLLSLLEEKRAVKAEDLLNAFLGEDRHAANRKKIATGVLQQFFQLGIVTLSREISPPAPCFGDKQVQNPGNMSRQPVASSPKNDTHSLSIPETVHWAITFRCLENCPDCYARRYREQGLDELGTADALQVVETLAHWGVFQLAVGGGEPLLRPDLPLIARVAKESGLVLHITTGLVEGFNFELLEQLAPAVKSLHIGIKQDRLLARPQLEGALLQRIVHAAHALGLSTGANLILCNTVIKHFAQLLEYLIQAGFKRVILLRYKPPFDVSRWLAENPSPETLRHFHNVLWEVAKLYPHLEIRLDCALSFLQRNLTPDAALAAGLRGCVAASRVLAISADGSMYPCSQLMSPRFKAGNILNEDFSSAWRNGKAMKKYRFFRDKRKFLETKCGACRARKQCGGCRVFAQNALGEDPGCEDPLFPSVQQLGREGRKAALIEYFKMHFSISVGKYIDYFQVGQNRAIKELKNTAWLRQENPLSSGRKMADSYIRHDSYLLKEVQASIGFTSGGAPYVPLETIKQWLAEPDLRCYPRWLLSEHGD